MELLDLYDEYGNKLNKTIERGKKFVEGYIMLCISIIKNSNDEYLIQKTSKKKGAKYAFTGGHVLHDETGTDAIVREIEEELGLYINESDINDTIIDKHPNGKALVNLYFIEKDINIDSLKLQKEEVESVSFIKKIK